MKYDIKQPIMVNGIPSMMSVPIENIIINEPAIISIDGSTSNTGISIHRSSDAAVYCTISVSRDKSGSDTESPVRYKLRLKKFVTDVLRRFPCITQVLYEEPCLDNPTAIPNTMMLRTFVEELIIENEPEFDKLYHVEINNKRWKKLFLYPEPCPVGTEREKEAVKNKILRAFPYFKDISQDEMDAIGMGVAYVSFIRSGNDRDAIKSRKAIKPFEYVARFVGGDDDEDLMIQFPEVYDGPQKILSNGVNFSTIKKTTKFDRYIYETMGEEDKVLVVKYKSKDHGDVTLKNNIGELALNFEYIYAIVWRKSRKK